MCPFEHGNWKEKQVVRSFQSIYLTRREREREKERRKPKSQTNKQNKVAGGERRGGDRWPVDLHLDRQSVNTFLVIPHRAARLPFLDLRHTFFFFFPPSIHLSINTTKIFRPTKLWKISTTKNNFVWGPSKFLWRTCFVFLQNRFFWFLKNIVCMYVQ
jgi:hypothetical protein